MEQSEYIPINGNHARISLSFSKIEEYREISNFMPYGNVLLCFDDSEAVFSDQYVVFWGQARSHFNEIVFDDETTERYVDEFTIAFDKLPNNIQEIRVFPVCLPPRNLTYSQLFFAMRKGFVHIRPPFYAVITGIISIERSVRSKKDRLGLSAPETES